MPFYDSLITTSQLNNIINFLPLKPIGVLLLITSIACLALYLNSRFQTAQPNQWLLVIKDGKLKKAGVGLKQFVFPGQTIVKFTSRVERTQFKAMNVTQQMQGISIDGFAFWTVDREGDGPFKCYKYMNGGNVNQYVKTLCQSIVRNELANCKLSEVMKNRDLLKQNIKNQLSPQLKGWGIWLETVELTDVKICSKKVFEDLQAQYRCETNLKAQIIKLQANTKSETQRIASELKMLKTREEGETEKQKSILQQQLKRKEQETTYFEQNSDVEIKKLTQQKLLSLDNRKKDHEIAIAEQKRQQAKQQKNLNLKLENQRKDIQKDKLYTPIALKKYKIDALQKMYDRINFGEVKISQFVPQKDGSLYSLLPGFKEIISESKKAQEV